MTVKQTFFLLILGLIAGIIGGGLFTMYSKRHSKSEESRTEDIGDLSDEDFLASYQDKKNSLTLGERKLGDRLFECLESKLDLTEKPEKSEIKQLPKPAHTKVFIDEVPIQKPTPKGDVSFYKTGGLLAPPLQVSGDTIMSLFPGKTFHQENENNFGFENNEFSDVNSFLKNHLCSDPDFSIITGDMKSKSKFFQAVKEIVFQGSTEVLKGALRSTFHTKIQFNSPSHDGADYLETVDDKKNILEKRSVGVDGGQAWRYSSCQPSVVLLSNRCPWNDKYSQEFKDFYFSPESKKLIGNVYCKNTTEKSWKHIGTFDLQKLPEDE